MNIVVLDGYAANPGDLCWDELQALGAPPLRKYWNALLVQKSC